MTINEWLLQFQIPVRLTFFMLFFTILAVWETADPWRLWMYPRFVRWVRHLGLTTLSKIFIKLLFPMLAVGIAIQVEKQGLGLLHQRPLHPALAIIIGVIALDFVIYVQHRILHNLTWLWRVHRVHHIDRQVDVSTGIRFHPIEEIYTMGFKIIGIGFFGVNPLAALIFEVIYNGVSLFTHVNVSMSQKMEEFLQQFIVTPGMHRIHHSDIHSEMNSNFSFGLNIWDKLFGTYVKVSQTGERKLSLGVETFRDPKYQEFENMLWIPFNLKRLRVIVPKLRKTKKSFIQATMIPIPEKGKKKKSVSPS